MLTRRFGLAAGHFQMTATSKPPLSYRDAGVDIEAGERLVPPAPLPLSLAAVEDLYPLSPMQQGMLFHTLYEPEAQAYINQLRLDIDGLQPQRFEQAWQAALDAHCQTEHFRRLVPQINRHQAREGVVVLMDGFSAQRSE